MAHKDVVVGEEVFRVPVDGEAFVREHEMVRMSEAMRGD
jgi:hypothetical protein